MSRQPQQNIEEEKHINTNINTTGMIIRPFCGYHPPSKLMAEIASPPYDVINTEQARSIANNNPKSFLNVNKPEIQFPKSDNINPYDNIVYKMGRTQIDKFCNNKWLIQDQQPSLYIYSQKIGSHEQYGIVTEASAIQYEQNIIKKHELTRKKKEDDRTKLTDTQSANVGPIFLCYKSVPAINDIITNYTSTNKAYSDFITNDSVHHKLWIINDTNTINILVNLFSTKVSSSYVADGHHRIASAWRVYQKRKSELQKNGEYTGNEPFHYFLAVLFPHDQLNILNYNRVVSNFGVRYKGDKDGFLKALQRDWIYQKIGYKEEPKDRNDFRMYIANDGWYRLWVKKNVVNKVKDDVVECLDVSILSQYLLKPVMGIMDIRSDPNISFIGGIHGLKGVEERVDGNGCGVGFVVYPTSIKQLLDVADANKLMPPKSTWFEPKLRSGVIVRRF